MFEISKQRKVTRTRFDYFSLRGVWPHEGVLQLNDKILIVIGLTRPRSFVVRVARVLSTGRIKKNLMNFQSD